MSELWNSYINSLGREDKTRDVPADTPGAVEKGSEDAHGMCRLCHYQLPTNRASDDNFGGVCRSCFDDVNGAMPASLSREDYIRYSANKLIEKLTAERNK
jgi:hypothetical protein